MSNTVVSDAAAYSIQAPIEGLCDATVTTGEESLDCKALVGKYVYVQAEGCDIYVAFAATSTPTINLAAATTVTAMVPILCKDGVMVPFVVQADSPVMKYKAKSGSGAIRVVRS